jgi:hypothetical protein
MNDGNAPMVLPFGMLLELLLRRHRLFEGVDSKSTPRDLIEAICERPVEVEGAPQNSNVSTVTER